MDKDHGRGAKMKVFYIRDKRYWRLLLTVALPITLQNLIFNSFSLVDNILVGGLGEVNIAAVGVANKLSFIFMLFLFGINSGANIFTAQFWGRRDLQGVRRVLGLSLILGITVAIPFTLVGIFWGRSVISIFSQDPEVIKEGATYLAIVAMTFPINALTSSYGMQSRGVGRAKVPLLASASGFLTNAVLDYVLIYGKFGFPSLGVKGAALATVFAKILECTILLAVTYGKQYELAAKIKEFRGYTKEFLMRFARPVLPVILSEIFWAVGVSGYTYFYGQVGTDAVATVQILDVINGLFLSLFMGVGNAAGTMVGNLIGAGEEKTAEIYAKRSAVLSFGSGLVMSGLLLLIAPHFLKLFNISAGTLALAQQSLVVYAAFMSIKVINNLMIVGVCRGGGDTLFPAILDLIAPWFIGLPMAYLGVQVFRLPLPFVIAMINSEEAVKFVLVVWRLFSGKWLHNLVEDMPAEEPADGAA